MNGVTKRFTQTNHSNRDFLSSTNVLCYTLGFSRAQNRQVLVLTELMQVVVEGLGGEGVWKITMRIET